MSISNIQNIKNKILSSRKGEERITKTAKRSFPNVDPELIKILTELEIAGSPQEIQKVYKNVASSCLKGNPFAGYFGELETLNGNKPIRVVYNDECRCLIREDNRQYLKAYGPYAGKVEAALEVAGFSNGNSGEFWDGLGYPAQPSRPTYREITTQVEWFRVTLESKDKPSKKGWWDYSVTVDKVEELEDGWYRVTGTKSSDTIPKWLRFRNLSFSKFHKTLTLGTVKEYITVDGLKGRKLYFDGLGSLELSSFVFSNTTEEKEENIEEIWDDIWERLAS